MSSILAQIGTKVGSEIRNLDIRLSSAENEIINLGGQTPPPTGNLVINPVQWTNLTEINLSGEKAQNISFDPPPLGLGVEVEVLSSWVNGGKTAQVGEVYTIDLVQSNGGMRLTGNGQSLFASANQLATQVKALHPSDGIYQWSVSVGTLDQNKLADGILKGVGGGVSVQQMFSTPLAIGTKIVVKATRADFGTGGVAFKHLKADGNPQGGNVFIPASDGFVEYEVVTSAMHGIRIATNNGSHAISSVSVFQGVVSGGSVQANGNGGIEKIAGAGGFNAGASSTNFIEGNSNGYVQFQWGSANKSLQIGLTYLDDDYGNVEPFRLVINGNGHVFTNGNNIFGGGSGWASQGDYFRIRHFASDNTIRFQKREEIFDNGASIGTDYVTFHTHSELSNGNNLYVDTSLFHVGSRLNDVLLAK